MSLIDKYGSDHQKRVAAFMRGAGQAVPDYFVIPSSIEARKLRAMLRLEEALEEIEALGFAVEMRQPHAYVSVHTVRIENQFPLDLARVIDGVCDNRVIGSGTLCAFGLPDVPFIEEVDRSNLAKLDGGWTDENGKFRKPANWTPPDIAGVLHRIQGESR